MKIILLITILYPTCGFGLTSLEVGISISNLQLKDNDKVDVSKKWCTRLGVYHEVTKKHLFSFSPGVILETKGQNFKLKSRDFPDASAILSYIQFPLISNLDFENNKNKFRIIFGPEPGFLMKAEEKTTFTKRNTYDLSNKFDLGIKAGAGLEIPGKECVLIFKIAYYYGFLNVPKDGNNKNRNIQISFGIGM